jgi:hypothetical protein
MIAVAMSQLLIEQKLWCFADNVADSTETHGRVMQTKQRLNNINNQSINRIFSEST